MNPCHSRFERIGMAQNQNHRIMKRINTTTCYLLLILAAAILNRLTDGTMNLIITVTLCLALIPAAIRLDREDKKAQKKE